MNQNPCCLTLWGRFLKKNNLLLSLSFLFAGAPIALNAQCQLVCNNSVQASLDENCENEITPDDLLEGTLPAACFDEFTVQLFGPNGLPLPNSPVLTAAQIGIPVTGKVIHTPSGQSCQTGVTVEDKMPPKIVCLDTLLSVFHDTTPTKVGIPLFYDNCTVNVSVTYFDQATTFNCTMTDTVMIIDRHWTVTDSSNHTATCTQKIYIERPPLDSIDFPANLDNLSAPALYCTSADTTTAVTGVPMFDSLLVDSIWGFFNTYEDVTAPICDGSFTVFRDWTLYDACRLDWEMHRQAINVMDTLAPQLICPTDVVVTVANNTCQATVALPQPTTYDSCSAIVNVALEGSFGWVGGMTIPDLTRGIYPTTCHATDDCGNRASCQFTITVIDNVPPVAVSISSPVVALLPSGTTYLPATSFNGGSWDNCDGMTFSVKRLDNPGCPGNDGTDFGNQVPFHCCDAGGLVEIVLQVQDASGNVSTVNTFVQVRDNIAPKLTCPPNLTIDCEADPADPTVTMMPAVTENCSGYDLAYVDVVNLDACGEGTISRKWTVEDIGGLSDNCTQTIMVKNLTPFHINPSNPDDPNDSVIWPKNYIANSCGAGLAAADLPGGFSFPQLVGSGDCQQIAMNYTDTWLSQPNNACIEILRRWTIVDWCQFNPLTFEGSWEYAQVIRIQQSDHPVISSTCDFEEFCSYDPNCQSGQFSIQLGAKDDCTALPDLRFRHAIDYFDNGTDDSASNGQTAAGQAPLGIHRIYWEVEDVCGNITYCDFLFSIVDCQKPSLDCGDLSIAITDDVLQNVTVHAGSLIASASDNCTSTSGLRFSFSQITTDSIRVFDCEDAGANNVNIWATDLLGNQGQCSAQITILMSNICSDASIVNGNMAMPDGENVALVMVSLNTATSNDSVMTDLDGNYLFNNVVLGHDYTVAPHKDIDHSNGVTTFDLVLLTRHILGTQPFDSPYKVIAADANRSGTVTTLDMVFIRKLILNVNTTFPGNTSWRFVDKNYVFNNIATAAEAPFPEVVNINDLSGNFMADFVAIKVGDVNFSAEGDK